MNDRAFSTEMQLLLASCQWPPVPEVVQTAAGADLDWTAFFGLLDRHGVVALAGQALWKAGVAIPTGQDAILRKSVGQQVQHSLRMAREAARLAQAFAETGISCRFFKGPTLAQLAYSDFGLKRSADIDVLIPPAGLQQALDLLDKAGYVAAMARELDRPSFARYLRLAKEVAFVDSRGTVLEVHLRVSENNEMLRHIGVDCEPQFVAIGSVSVPTFSDRILYPYLCYHGAVHGWSRLKWLVDLNAFLEGRDVEALHRDAVEQGVESASLVALSLCQTLLRRDVSVVGKLTVLERLQRRISLGAIRHPLGGSDVTSIPLAIALRICGATIGGSFSSARASLQAMWSQPQMRARYTDDEAWLFHASRIPRFIWSLPRRLWAIPAEPTL